MSCASLSLCSLCSFSLCSCASNVRAQRGQRRTRLAKLSFRGLWSRWYTLSRIVRHLLLTLMQSPSGFLHRSQQFSARSRTILTVSGHARFGVERLVSGCSIVVVVFCAGVCACVRTSARFLLFNLLILNLVWGRRLGNPTARLLSRLFYYRFSARKAVIVSYSKDFYVSISEYLYDVLLQSSRIFAAVLNPLSYGNPKCFQSIVAVW